MNKEELFMGEEMLKKAYERPVIDLFAVGKKDIITVSGVPSGGEEEGETGEGEDV